MKALAALLALAALATPAHAKRDPGCACPVKRVVPAPNATDVPTNAHFWRLPSQTPGTPIKPYELATHTGYVLEDTSFTTGSGPDHEPPITPSVAAASIALESHAGLRLRISTLHITATTSPDTAVVHLHFFDGHHDVDYYTTPDQLTVCDPDLLIVPGHVRLDVSAIDLAGNESEPDTRELDTVSDQYPSPTCDSTTKLSWRQTHDDEIGYAFLLGILGVGAFVVLTNVRTRRRRAAARDELALPAAEYVVRTQRLLAMATIVVCGIAASVVLRRYVVYSDGAAPLIALVVIDAILTYIAAGRMRVLLRYDGATATVQYDEVTVTIAKQTVTLRASPRVVARARHHALPRATL